MTELSQFRIVQPEAGDQGEARFKLAVWDREHPVQEGAGDLEQRIDGILRDVRPSLPGWERQIARSINSMSLKAQVLASISGVGSRVLEV